MLSVTGSQADVADVDRDGDDDIVTGPTALRLSVQTTPGTFITHTLQASAGWPRFVDVDASRSVGIAFMVPGTTSSRLAFVDCSSTCTPSFENLGNGWFQATGAVDLDQDGRVDLVGAANHSDGLNIVAAYVLNLGAGRWRRINLSEDRVQAVIPIRFGDRSPAEVVAPLLLDRALRYRSHDRLHLADGFE